MKVQISTDGNIRGHHQMTDQFMGSVEDALSRISDRVTRVEVHLSDVGGHGRGRGANDMRCMMEARLEGRSPIAVTHKAAILDLAVEGAAEKLARMIESTLGKLNAQKKRRTDPPEIAEEYSS
jgi:ribosome-associated translation inhibitor RaiA